MNKFRDKDHLKNVQYVSSDNLDARIALHKKYTPEGENWKTAWDVYNFRPDQKVIEVGCGTGLFWTYQPPSKSTPLHLTLTDFSEGMLDAAKKNLAQSNISAKFEIADVDRLPYPASTYDVVLAHFMLYHAQSPPDAIDEIRRVLKPGGWAGIILVSKDNMSDIFEAAHQINPELNALYATSSLFSAEDAEGLLRSKFGSVESHEYRYTMKVDEADYVVKYAQSSPSFQSRDLTNQFWSDYAGYVSEEIKEKGAFEVTKRFVLFNCHSN